MFGAVGYKVITLNRNQKELYPIMNTFTKKSLHVALAGLGTLGLAGAADAVMVNPNGLGQVLIYPYYTVRSPAGAGLASYNTLLSVVNTTTSTKAVKVRFREGKASGKYSTSTCSCRRTTCGPRRSSLLAARRERDSAPSGAQIETSDRSCTIPNFIAWRSGPVPQRRLRGRRGETTRKTRLTEGYFEIFEMATYDKRPVIAINAKHSGGVPKDCSQVTTIRGSSRHRCPRTVACSVAPR